jgi:PAT family beta-lactamase induction signal transducer AmpG
VAGGRFQTAHYALGTGVMQLGFMLSKTLSGDVQLLLGYQAFFLWVVLCRPAGAAADALVRLRAEPANA